MYVYGYVESEKGREGSQLLTRLFVLYVVVSHRRQATLRPLGAGQRVWIEEEGRGGGREAKAGKEGGGIKCIGGCLSTYQTKEKGKKELAAALQHPLPRHPSCFVCHFERAIAGSSQHTYPPTNASVVIL